MGNVTQIWNTGSLARGMRRYWVDLHKELLICGDRENQNGVLSIHQITTGGRLFATIKVALCRLTEEIHRGGKLVIDIHDLRLVVLVRAVEDTRVLVEFAVPRGQNTQIALN